MPSSNPPALNLSPGVAWAAGVLIGIHVLRAFLGDGPDAALLVTLGFQPVDFWSPGAGPVLPPFGLAWLTPLTHQLLHGDAMHLIVNTGFLLAFGTVVERRLGSRRFLGLAVLSGAVAAFGIMPGFITEPAPTVLIGASGAISGLFGAMLHFAFRRQPGQGGGLPPAMLAALAFVAANVLIGVFGLFSGGPVRAIAWEAHIAGMIAGWLLFPLFDPSRRAGAA
jgi:membrane associated rhomboid family serine protease